jgi:chromate transporter
MRGRGSDGERTRLREVARVFLKLGVIGFGGPAAHVALMRREIVEQRRWVDEDRFLQLFGASSLIPGPSSTELGMMLGFERAGWPGLFVAGVCFITPAMTIVLTLAWAYVRFGHLPQTGWILYGVGPVMLVIIADALWQLGRRALRSWLLAVTAAAVLAGYVVGIGVVILLLGGAAIATVARNISRLRGAANLLLPSLPVLSLTSTVDVPPTSLFLEFLKLGAVAFGSGYVLVAFLHADLVEHLGWLTQRQLIDAVSIGQVTPGPVFTTATFIGYVAGGLGGAILATAGIFLPAFVFAGLVYLLLPRLQRSPWTAAFIDGVTVSALALMAGVTIQLGRTVYVDVATVVLSVASFAVLRRWKLNSAWLVVAGAVIGLILGGFGIT